MADIHFSCPYCNGSLVVDDEGAGWEVDCPYCSEPVIVPIGDEVEVGVDPVEPAKVIYLGEDNIPGRAKPARTLPADGDKKPEETGMEEEPGTDSRTDEEEGGEADAEAKADRENEGDALKEAEAGAELEEEASRDADGDEEEEEAEAEAEESGEAEREEEPPEATAEPDTELNLKPGFESNQDEEESGEDEVKNENKERGELEDGGAMTAGVEEQPDESEPEPEGDKDSEESLAEPVSDADADREGVEKKSIKKPGDKAGERTVRKETRGKKGGRKTPAPRIKAASPVAPGAKEGSANGNGKLVLPKPRGPAAVVATGAMSRSLREKWALFRCSNCSVVFKTDRKNYGALVSCPECDTKTVAERAPAEGRGGASKRSVDVLEASARKDEAEFDKEPPSKAADFPPRFRPSGRTKLEFPAMVVRGPTGKIEGPKVVHRDLTWDSDRTAQQLTAGFGGFTGRENRWVAIGALLVLALFSVALISIVLTTSRRDESEGRTGADAGLGAPAGSEAISAGTGPGSNASPAGAVAEAVALSGFSYDFVRRTFGQAQTVLERFLTADDLDERLRYSHAPGKVRAIVSKRPDLALQGPIPYSQILDTQFTVVADQSLLLLRMEAADFSVKEVALHYEPDGYYKVDWQWFMESGEMAWDEFLANKPQEPVLFRLIASPNDYFNYEYDDPERFDCYRLFDSGQEHQVWGYVPKDDPIAPRLKAAFQRLSTGGADGEETGLALRCVVRMKFPGPNGRPDMVDLTDFVQSDWRSL